VPEVPDLEAIRSFFNRRIVGQTVERVDAVIPFIVRLPRDEFERLMTGDTFGETHRFGKFLLFSLASGRVLVINPMLTGRFALVSPKVRRAGRTALVLALSGGDEFRYADQRVMGRIYLTTPDKVQELPQFNDAGPDVLSPDLTEEAFRDRLKKHSGQIKGILVNHKFVSGIGNAYSDEILWEAMIHPYRKRTSLTDEELSRLYKAIHTVIDWAIGIVAKLMEEQLEYKEWRDHLKVHRRGGTPCPRCGTTISEVTAGQRITSFCRTCQPEVPHL
jgi:formamidopyrimidine-DNA glycosylase